MKEEVAGGSSDTAFKDRYVQGIIKDAIPDAMILKAPDGSWLEWNRAAEELRLTSSIFSESNPVLSPECTDSDREALASDSFIRNDETLPDGRIFNVTKTPIRNPDGSPHGILVLARDVTEARGREIRLGSLNRLVRTLKDIDRMIIGCRTPDALLQGVVATLVESGFLRNCAAFTVATDAFAPVFRKAPLDCPAKTRFLSALDRHGWQGSILQGEQLSRAVPEIQSGDWAALRIFHEGRLFGYLLAEISGDVPFPSDQPLTGMLEDIAGDLGYALQGMLMEWERRRSEAQVLRTRDMLDSFLENFPGPAFIRDSNSVYLKTNREFLKTSGFEDWRGRSPEDIYPEDICAALRRRDGEVLEKGYLSRRRTIPIEGLGQRTLEVHYFRIDQGGGEPLIGGIGLDITDRLEAETALKTSEEKYRAIYENTGTAMVILNPAGIISEVNDNVELLTGYTREETVERMGWAQFVHPDDLEMVAEQRRQRLEGSEDRHLEYEFRLVRKDGSHRNVRMRTGTIPESGGAGVLSLSDITSLIEYQKQLNMSLEKTQALLQAIPDLMFVLSRDGVYIDFHARNRDQLAFPADELQGRNIGEIGLPEEAAREVLTALAKTLDTGSVQTLEYELDLPDGHHFYEAGLSPFEEDSVLVLCRDVTARKIAEAEQRKLESQIRHVQKLESLGVLAGGIAHDFNNILMAITGNVYLARRASESGDSPMVNLEAVEKAAGRAADLAGQMLAYSGRGEFKILPLSLNDVVREMTDMFKAAVSKKAEIVYCLDPDLPHILADGTQVRQVVMNLITNASEAIEQNRGRITISTGVMHCDREYIRDLSRTEDIREGNYAWIEVEDTGKGMTKDILARIFDPFFTTKFTGRGLGLSAVLGIMSSHAGAMKILTEPGSGSSFRALFPLAPSGGGIPIEPEEFTQEWTASGKVLLVDDEPLILSVGKAMLEAMGFSVITGKDGSDGLNRFMGSSGGISLVILDLTMPNMDGDEVFREIRKLDPDVPVLISSGYNENEILTRFADSPPDGFLKTLFRLGPQRQDTLHPSPLNSRAPFRIIRAFLYSKDGEHTI